MTPTVASILEDCRHVRQLADDLRDEWPEAKVVDLETRIDEIVFDVEQAEVSGTRYGVARNQGA